MPRHFAAACGVTLCLMAFGNSAAHADLAAAVLPASRSVQVGAAASAFATIINAGGATATACKLTPITSIPASFSYQTTDSHTNQRTGTVNTPVDIPAGVSQSFVFAFTPTAPFAPTDVQIEFKCSNTAAAPVLPGLNTLLLSGSSTPVPDIVALAATLSGDGIADIPGMTKTGVFAVATVNVGAASTITATVDTGNATLPVSLFLCQTDPASGACISAIGKSVATSISANATPTFGVFAQGAGIMNLDAVNGRAFIRFKDPDGVVRGATSVAVRTLLPTRGLWVQFERRGDSSRYWTGEAVQTFNDFDALLGHKVSDEIALQLDAMKALGVNTISLELRTADPTEGNFVYPACNINPALGFQYPQPTPTELTNIIPLFDLINSKGIKVVLVLVNTHMEDQTNSAIWVKAILNVVKTHPALDFVVFNGSAHYIDSNGDGTPDSCGIPAEAPLYLGPTSIPAQYVQFAISTAMGLGMPTSQLGAGTPAGDFFTDSQPPAGPEATDRHLWKPTSIMKGIFDKLGIPAEARVYALSFYEHHKCATARQLACVDAAPADWADQTLADVRSIVGPNARIMAYEMGLLTPPPSDWSASSTLASLVTVLEKYNASGGSYWHWTSAFQSEESDPNFVEPIKKRGVAFNYTASGMLLPVLYK